MFKTKQLDDLYDLSRFTDDDIIKLINDIILPCDNSKAAIILLELYISQSESIANFWMKLPSILEMCISSKKPALECFKLFLRVCDEKIQLPQTTPTPQCGQDSPRAITSYYGTPYYQLVLAKIKCLNLLVLADDEESALPVVDLVLEKETSRAHILGDTEFFGADVHAIDKNKMKFLQRLLSQSPRYPFTKGTIRHAVKNYKFEMMQVLLEHGETIDFDFTNKDKKYRTFSHGIKVIDWLEEAKTKNPPAPAELIQTITEALATSLTTFLRSGPGEERNTFLKAACGNKSSQEWKLLACVGDRKVILKDYLFTMKDEEFKEFIKKACSDLKSQEWEVLSLILAEYGAHFDNQKCALLVGDIAPFLIRENKMTAFKSLFRDLKNSLLGYESNGQEVIAFNDASLSALFAFADCKLSDSEIEECISLLLPQFANTVKTQIMPRLYACRPEIFSLAAEKGSEGFVKLIMHSTTLDENAVIASITAAITKNQCVCAGIIMHVHSANINVKQLELWRRSLQRTTGFDRNTVAFISVLDTCIKTKTQPSKSATQLSFWELKPNARITIATVDAGNPPKIRGDSNGFVELKPASAKSSEKVFSGPSRNAKIAIDATDSQETRGHSSSSVELKPASAKNSEKVFWGSSRNAIIAIDATDSQETRGYSSRFVGKTLGKPD